MEIAVSHPAFTTRKLVVRTGGHFSGPKVFVDGHRADGKRGCYDVPDNGGKMRKVKLRGAFFDAVPTLYIDEEKVQLARPLTWYEYAWMALPMILAIAGGALGALFGLGAIYSSARIFRSTRSPFSKYAISGLISVGAVTGFIILAGILHIMVHGMPKQ